ncbi:hypothetical protein FOXG_18469 [Fusarium oxysporum f. sp. lycopersici 4287]|uniref:Uncharacterized protein n=2 Tax=Fusarium oxysporum TaxID=5507 RepID=A0A0J9UIZ5_FUSO4|nr:hypothetical protein FOXG_18469 [Fusarium oxysporum f. sp. lycopersici 4287]EXK34013.1 hypothetical protein FOMG_11170 [Fusarium oxysporum f. sp. melonis 26406]KNA98822.1 hypothetical protein FOXG_18469 [Fusarium oxysporum f. sp. lycopersici 4287]
MNQTANTYVTYKPRAMVADILGYFRRSLMSKNTITRHRIVESPLSSTIPISESYTTRPTIAIIQCRAHQRLYLASLCTFNLFTGVTSFVGSYRPMSGMSVRDVSPHSTRATTSRCGTLGLRVRLDQGPPFPGTAKMQRRGAPVIPGQGCFIQHKYSKRLIETTSPARSSASTVVRGRTLRVKTYR